MRKKLFAVIMSVMMMVTFMPTMAFATITPATSGKWNASHTEYTDSTGYVWSGENVYKFVDNQSGWDGKICAGAFDYDGNPITGSFEEIGYDLSYAYVSRLNGLSTETSLTDAWAKSRVKFTRSQAEDLLNSPYGYWNNDYAYADVTGLKFTVPSYVTYAYNGTKMVAIAKAEVEDSTEMEAIYDSTSSYYVFKDGNSHYLGSFRLKMPKNYDFSKSLTEDQNFSLKVETTNVDYDYFDSFFIGRSVPSRKMTILKGTAELTDVYYELEGDKNDGEVDGEVYYNGKEHKLTQKELTGYTSTYKLWNEETATYEAVEGDSVSFKNVGDYHVLATAKDSKGNTYDQYLDITVNKVCDAEVGLKATAHWNENTEEYDYSINVAGKFEPAKYMDAWFQGDLNSMEVKAAKSAVLADKKELIAYVNELWDVVVEDSYAHFEEKDLTTTEVKAIQEKYKEVLGNYNDVIAENDYTFVNVVDDIAITNAPLSKTYKAKNGKLAKAHKFTVKASSFSGDKIYFKVSNGAGGKITVNKTSGKVTVKKGLKKGTYKIKVYAKSLTTLKTGDTCTIKIKVK